MHLSSSNSSKRPSSCCCSVVTTWPRWNCAPKGAIWVISLATSSNRLAPDMPNWGGWGGRYLQRQPYGETRPIWTQGGDSFRRVTSADTVNGVTSDQATIWRWRSDFQNDFAARMDWTVKPFGGANHPPVVAIAGLHVTGCASIVKGSTATVAITTPPATGATGCSP